MKSKNQQVKPVSLLKGDRLASENRKLLLALMLILSFAAVLRFANLATLPVGLNRDESFDGLNALAIIAGERPVFLVENGGRESMNAYLIALSVAVFGRSPAAVRLPSALASIFMVLGVYLLTASLTNRRIGLLAAVICTFTLWPILLGRLATRPVLLPLFLAFGLWLGVRAWQTGRYWYWALAGMTFGLAFYTYTPVRIVIFALPLWALVLIVGGHARRLWPGAAIFAVTLSLVVAPFAIYAAGNWEVVAGRSTQVSMVSLGYSVRDNVMQVVSQIYIVLQMFVIPGKGDLVWGHNVSGRAVFDGLMALPFVIGLGLVVLRRKWRLTLLLCGLWVGVGLLPTILSKGAPHFLRAAAILPVLFIWPAIGLDWMHRQLAARTHPALALVVAGGVLLGSAAITTNDYLLNHYLARPEVVVWFEVPTTDLAVQINRFLGVGWQGDGLFAGAPNPLSSRRVWIDPAVWPREMWVAADISTHQPTLEFLLPSMPDTTPTMRFHDPAAALPAAELADEMLFIVLPGNETALLTAIPDNYIVTVEDSRPQLPIYLREPSAWLVYRRVIASVQSAKWVRRVRIRRV